MEFTIESFSTKRFLLIGLLPTPLVVGLPIWLAVSLDSFLFIGLLVPLFAAVLYSAFTFSKQQSHISIKENHFVVDGRRVDFNSVDGYHVNDIGIAMDSFDIRLKNGETVILTGWNSGEKGDAFKEVIKNIINNLKSCNSECEELEYQHVHVKQMRYMRPLVYISIPVVVVVDFYLIYLKITDGRTLPWQLFFLNFLVLTLIPYLKKRK